MALFMGLWDVVGVCGLYLQASDPEMGHMGDGRSKHDRVGPAGGIVSSSCRRFSRSCQLSEF